MRLRSGKDTKFWLVLCVEQVSFSFSFFLSSSFFFFFFSMIILILTHSSPIETQLGAKGLFDLPHDVAKREEIRRVRENEMSLVLPMRYASNT